MRFPLATDGLLCLSMQERACKEVGCSFIGTLDVPVNHENLTTSNRFELFSTPAQGHCSVDMQCIQLFEAFRLTLQESQW